MKGKIKIATMLTLALTAGYLADQVYYKWQLLSLLENKQQERTRTTPKTKINEDKKEKSNSKKETKQVDYTKDKTWSKLYSKKGDRTARFICEDSIPVFKKKYTTWTGKQYLEKTKLEQVVKSVITRLPHIKNDKDVINLVVETAIAESSGGYNIDSTNGDHGVFQIRVGIAEETINWLKDNHRDVFTIIEKFRDKKMSLTENLDKNIPFGVAICASEYWRKAGPNFYNHIKTQKDRAIMWKSVYNTRLGLGTVYAYIERNKEYSIIEEKVFAEN